jgi:hypothetical protein
MNDVRTRIERLLDTRFVTDYLGLRSDEGYIAGHATCFYLEELDLEKLRPDLNPPHYHADVGQVACYNALPVCPMANRKENGQPYAEYQGIFFTYWVFREVLPPSSFREWLGERKEDESKKKPAFKALDTYDVVAKRIRIGKEELAPIVDAARCRYFVSWDIGMTFLSRLGWKHSVARDVMADLMLTGKADEKVRLLATLTDHLPKSFCLNLLRRGLKDRSKFVRRTAAEVSRRLILSEIVDELCQAAGVERDAEAGWPNTKWQLQHAIALIRDGYDLYKRPDGSEAFVVRISDGFPATLHYPGPAYTEEDIRQRGAKVVAEEVRRQNASATMRAFNWPSE